MNLHEECLLKYLLNPADLLMSTKILEHNNDLIKDGSYFKKRTEELGINYIPHEILT